MNNASIKFLIYILVVAIICVVLQFIWNAQMAESMKLKSGYILLGVFIACVTAVHIFLLRSAQGSPQGFIRNFMLATVLKFFVYLTVLIGFLLYSTENKKTLILHFLFYYAVFTTLEVAHLYSELRKLKNNPGI